MEQDIRWVQRFAHFDRAVVLLREPFDQGIYQLSELEKEGTIQRFEFAVELAWKTLKDYMQHEGHQFISETPRTVIKDAFTAGILPDGQVWVEMLVLRNLLSHTYDAATFYQALDDIQSRHLKAIEQLHLWFMERRMEQCQ